MPRGRLKVVRTRGEGRARGRMLGQALGREIRAFVGDGLARTASLRATPLDRAQLAPLITPYAAAVCSHLPDLADEVEGLAEGAEIASEEAWLLQFRRELIESPACDCTTLASTEPVPVLGQTIDLTGHMGDVLHVLQVSPERGPRALLVTFAGLLGYLGVNAAGLAVGINMVASDDWRVGISPYLLVRAALGCASVREALDLLARLPRASSRCLTLIDPHEAAAVEMTATDQQILTGPVLLHTNHFLDRALRAHERIDPVIRMESRYRLARLRALTKSPPADAESVAALLERADFQRGPAVERSQLETVATVVLEPSATRVRVRVAGAASWDTFDMDEEGYEHLAL